jgi:pimeloyl-ACP methyl ester carboxylesterase
MCRPERVRRLVKCNWYGVYSMHEMARAPGFGYAQLRTLWYVWLLNTPVGETILGSDRAGFVRALWEEWSPTWSVDARASALEAVLPSFAGEDWARVALSAYRSGTVPTETDPADEALRAMLQNPSPVRCPTRVVRGVDDGVERSSLAADARARWFPGGLAVTELAGVGHWPQREAPDAVVDAVLA